MIGWFVAKTTVMGLRANPYRLRLAIASVSRTASTSDVRRDGGRQNQSLSAPRQSTVRSCRARTDPSLDVADTRDAEEQIPVTDFDGISVANIVCQLLGATSGSSIIVLLQTTFDGGIPGRRGAA